MTSYENTRGLQMGRRAGYCLPAKKRRAQRENAHTRQGQ